MSGRVLREKRSSRARVTFDSSRKVGKTSNVCASASSCDAVASNVLFEFTINCWSAPSRWLIAANVRPVFLTSWRTATFCSSSTFISRAPSTANGARLPKASLRSSLALPPVALANSRIHSWKALRVGLSNAEKISSSCTARCTRELGRNAPSLSVSADLWPGAICM
jgi:hypothetical protein